MVRQNLGGKAGWMHRKKDGKKDDGRPVKANK